jgi:hypothetical protein
MEIDISPHTGVDSGIDGIAVFTDAIIASQIIHKVRVAPMVGSGLNRAITGPISIVDPGSAVPKRGFDCGRGVEMHVYAHNVADQDGIGQGNAAVGNHKFPTTVAAGVAGDYIVNQAW